MMYKVMYNRSAMGRMIRKQIYLDREQDEMLKRRSKELGISEAALIRRCINEVAVQKSAESERQRAWQELFSAMDERAKIHAPQTGRTWTRDQLYEERFERYSR
jgi:hypothetical protein